MEPLAVASHDVGERPHQTNADGKGAEAHVADGMRWCILHQEVTVVERGHCHPDGHQRQEPSLSPKPRPTTPQTDDHHAQSVCGPQSYQHQVSHIPIADEREHLGAQGVDCQNIGHRNNCREGHLLTFCHLVAIPLNNESDKAKHRDTYRDSAEAVVGNGVRHTICDPGVQVVQLDQGCSNGHQHQGVPAGPKPDPTLPGSRICKGESIHTPQGDQRQVPGVLQIPNMGANRQANARARKVDDLRPEEPDGQEVSQKHHHREKPWLQRLVLLPQEVGCGVEGHHARCKSPEHVVHDRGEVHSVDELVKSEQPDQCQGEGAKPP